MSLELGDSDIIDLWTEFLEKGKELIIFLNSNGVILYANPHAIKVFGLPQNFKGKRIELFAGKTINELNVGKPLTIISADGKEIILNLSLHYLDDEKVILKGSVCESDKPCDPKAQKMLRGIAMATEELLNNTNFESAVQKSLIILGKAVEVDRIYLFQNSFNKDGKMLTSQRFEWAKSSVEPQINNPELQDVPVENFDDFFPTLVSNRTIQAIISRLPKGSALREILESQDIKSILQIPIFHEGDFWGFVGYDDCTRERIWSDEETYLLKSFVSNISAALERSQRTFELKRQEEKFRNIISNINLGLLEVDKDDVIQFCNKCFTDMTGYELSEIKGKNASDLFITDKDKYILSQKHKIRLSGSSDSYEVQAKNKNGEKRWWLISGAPNYNDKGEVTGSIGIHLDITEQKKMEAKLEEALILAEKSSKAKDSFLSNMSHEIRTPLNAIIGMLRELRKLGLSEQQEGFINTANKASDHLLQIINNVLDVAKIEAGELKLEYKDFSIKQIIQDVKSILLPQAEEKNLEFKLQVEEKVAEAYKGDGPRLRQIILNLAGNALKFTEKGEVDICCGVEQLSDNADIVRITVKDTGIGIDENYQKQLFQKFHQEDATISRRFGGSGLGMVITKELVDLMNGDISVKSKKNEGTEIVVSILMDLGDEKNLELKDFDIEEADISGMRILLVEDNVMNRIIVRNILKSHKVELCEVENGIQALKKINKEDFDIILMDIQMPEMDGIEATIKIREELEMQTPVIGLSANAFKSEIEKCLSIGMNDYITKPFDEKVLIKILARFVNNPNKANAQADQNKSHKDDRLEAMKKSCYGNEVLMKQLQEAYIKYMPSIIRDIEDSIRNEDAITFKRHLHKIKPNIQSVGLEDLFILVQEIESRSPEDITIEHIHSSGKKIIERLKYSVKEMERISI